MIEINNKVECCGCTACLSVCPVNCIEMREDNEGFLYPHADKNICIHCGLCNKVCPITRVEQEKEKPQKAYLVQHNDKEILQESTSGGAFTAFAQTIIEKGGVVFGAAFDEDLEVAHIGVESFDKLYKFRNSKYVQSRQGSVFRQIKNILDSGKYVLYSGTPCQVEGLLRALKKNYTNLYTVDVVCHGCPSPLIWRKYKEYRAVNDKNLEYAKFRDKKDYGYEYSQMSLVSDKGREHYGVESDPYLRAFFENLSDRPCCYHCRFKKRYRVSDLTVWDCFDVYKIDKSFDDNKGVTRVLVHSEKGTELIANAYKYCRIKEIDVEKAVEGVKEMVASVPENPKRSEFFSAAESMQSVEFIEKWFPDTFKVKLERVIRKVCERLGIYRPVKRFAKKLLRK